ncbi:unnamed protein product, partial [Rotaria sp. Silwood2]
EPKLVVQPVYPRPGESDIDFSRRFTLEIAQFNAQRGILQFDVSEFTRLPLKATEYLVTPAILNKVYNCLYNELSKNGLMARIARLAIESQFIAAQIKNSILELKQNSILTPMLIEAVLTIIIDREDKYCQKLKDELGFEIFYTDCSKFHQNGVRVFKIRHLSPSSIEQMKNRKNHSTSTTPMRKRMYSKKEDDDNDVSQDDLDNITFGVDEEKENNSCND